LLKALKSDLGDFDEAAKRYPISYRDLVAKLKADLKSSNGQLASTNDELKTAIDKFQTLQKNQENYWKRALVDIKKGNDEAFKAGSIKYKEMEEQFAYTKKLNQINEEMKAKWDEEVEALNRKIRNLKADVA